MSAGLSDSAPLSVPAHSCASEQASSCQRFPMPVPRLPEIVMSVAPWAAGVRCHAKCHPSPVVPVSPSLCVSAHLPALGLPGVSALGLPDLHGRVRVSPRTRSRVSSLAVRAQRTPRKTPKRYHRKLTLTYLAPTRLRGSSRPPQFQQESVPKKGTIRAHCEHLPGRQAEYRRNRPDIAPRGGRKAGASGGEGQPTESEAGNLRGPHPSVRAPRTGPIGSISEREVVRCFR